MNSTSKQIKTVRDYHIATADEFDWRFRDSKGQSDETMRYYQNKAAFHRDAANLLKALSDSHGYKID